MWGSAKRTCGAVLAALAVVGCGSPSSPSKSTSRESQVLHFFNWEGELGPETIPEFERRTGIRVKTEWIIENVSLQTKLLTGGSGADLAVPNVNFLQPLIAAGAVQKLDHSRLPNRRHLDPAIMKVLERVDPGNQYAVPLIFGTFGVAYNTRAVAKALGREPEPSWQLVFGPENARRLQPCGIAWIDAAGSYITDLMLIALGRDPALKSADNPRVAEEAFMRARPYVRYLDNTLRTPTDLASGEICVAIGINGEMIVARETARQGGIDLRYVVPTEGSLMWIDLLVIPVGAPQVDAAYRLMDFLMEPQIIAESTNATRFANANRAADALVDPVVRGNPDIYPTPEVMSRLHLAQSESLEYTRERSRMWTRVRTAKQ